MVAAVPFPAVGWNDAPQRTLIAGTALLWGVNGTPETPVLLPVLLTAAAQPMQFWQQQ